MSHYSNNPSHIRVDFFKPSGKWYTTEVLIFDSYYSNDEAITDTFKRCLYQQFPQFESYNAVTLEPYHEHEHPLMRIVANN